MRRILSSLALVAVALAVITPAVTARQSDVVLSQRLPPVCNPQSSTPYLYYNVTDGRWHCTAVAPVVYNGSTLTVTAAELNKAHTITAGTAAASKYLLLDANSAINILRTASLRLGASGSEVAVTATAAEINKVAGVTGGTAAASKAVVLDANKAIAGQFIALGGGATTSPGATPGSLTDTTNATSGTTQSTEYTLNSVTLPASALNTTGQGVEVTAWGTLAANANAKNVKIYLGGTAIATVTGSTANAKDYLVTLRCIRTGSSTQSCVASIMIDTATSATMAVTAATETDTGAIIIALKTANTAAAAASGTGKGMLALFLNK